jgi:hypothetical protein
VISSSRSFGSSGKRTGRGPRCPRSSAVIRMGEACWTLAAFPSP